MIYPTRVFSAACARLGYFSGARKPAEGRSVENFWPDFFRLVATVLFLTPIPYIVLYIPLHIFFTAIDLAFNPPPQYFAQGILVCCDSSSCSYSPFYPSENYSVKALPPNYLAGSTSLCNQQAKLNSEPIAQNLESLLYPDYYPCRERYHYPSSFGGDDIIQNCIDAAASPIGFWLLERGLAVKEALTPGKVGGAS